MVWLILFACSGTEGISDGGSITGDLAIDGYDVAVEIVRAYGYDNGSEGVWDFPSNPEATCDDVVDLQNNYLVGKTDKIEPDEVVAGNSCRLFFNAQVADSAGSWGGTSSAPVIDAFWTLDCPLGDDDEFEWENRDGDKDYYWTGQRFSGNPVDWTTSVAWEGEGYRITLELNGFSGNYIDDMTELSVEGTLVGDIFVASCPGMDDSPWL